MARLAISRQDFHIGSAIPLDEEDLRVLKETIQTGTGPSGPADPGQVQKLRTSHHAVAQLFAKNLPLETVSIISGYTITNLMRLKSNPAFLELIAFYTVEEATANADMIERLKSMALDAVDVIHEKLLEAPEKIKIDELNKLLTTLLDRTGHGPVSTQKSVAVTATGTLAELRSVLGEGVTLRKARGAPATAIEAPVGEVVESSVSGEQPAEGSEGAGRALRAHTGEGTDESLRDALPL